jgi:hypothetical protein
MQRQVNRFNFWALELFVVLSQSCDMLYSGILSNLVLWLLRCSFYAEFLVKSNASGCFVNFQIEYAYKSVFEAVLTET